MLDHSDT